MASLEFVRRLGRDPHEAGDTPGLAGCPDVWELSNGDFAVIGIRSTSSLGPRLPATASCGPDEEIVLVPRRILTAAREDLPSE